MVEILKKTSLEKLFASENNTIIEVIEIINENELKTAFVIDNEKRLLGVVTDGDIRRAILKDIPLTSSINSIMNSKPFVIKTGIPESEVLKILLEKVILIIPVLDEKRRVVDYYHIYDFIKEEFLKVESEKKLSPKRYEWILVTGGAGYIGSTLVRILLEEGYSVRVLDKLVFGRESLEELKSNPKFQLIRGDFTKIEDLIPCLKDIIAVVHLAAIVGDPAGNIDPELTEETNFRSVKIFAEFCKYYGIKRFIFTSTCSVYGASSNELLSEESPLNPVSLYAETKLKAEKALFDLRNENFHPTILRLATVFGTSYRMRFDLVINLLTAFAKKRREISIFSGEQWRPFVHVKDVGNAISHILNQPLEKISGEIFNIGKDDNNYQIKEIGNIMKKIFLEIKVNIIEDKEDDRSYRVIFQKLIKNLNFTPEYDLEKGIREIADYLEKSDIDIGDKRFSNYKKVELGIYDSIYFAE